MFYRPLNSALHKTIWSGQSSKFSAAFDIALVFMSNTFNSCICNSFANVIFATWSLNFIDYKTWMFKDDFDIN